MTFNSPVPKKRARIEIIPLIDIMFFLLASFMMVSLSQVHMKGIRVNLPAIVAPTQPLPTPDPKDRVSLFVDPDGLVHFDKEVVTDGDVMPRLRRASSGESKSEALPQCRPRSAPRRGDEAARSRALSRNRESRLRNQNKARRRRRRTGCAGSARLRRRLLRRRHHHRRKIGLPAGLVF